MMARMQAYFYISKKNLDTTDRIFGFDITLLLG